MYFQASDVVFGTERWVYDGISASRVSDISTGAGNASPQSLYVFGGKLYFTANNGTAGPELYSYDGVTISFIADIRPGAIGSGPSSFVGFAGDLYFTANDGTNGSELWKYNGSTVSLAADINPGVGSSTPQQLTVYNGKIYFNANNGTSGQELFSYDGSSVSLAADIIPGIGSGNPAYFKQAGNFLYFRADDGINGEEIWASNGPSSSILSDVNPGAGGSGSVSSPGMVTFNGGLYFTANVPSLGDEVWSWIPPNVSPVGAIVPGAGSGNPSSLTIYNNHLYVAATDAANGSELWEFTLPTPNYDYRTSGSGNWRDSTTWEIYDGTFWVAATDAPDGVNSGVITIRAGHNISNASQGIDADQLVIENGGQLSLSEGTLHLLNGAGDDLTCNGTINMNTASIVVDGVAEFTGSSSFNWGGLTHLGGAGVFNIRQGCSFSIDGNSDHSLEAGAVLNNYTTCDFSSNTLMTIVDGSVFNNYFVFDITNNADISSPTSDGIFNNNIGGLVIISGGGLSTFFSGFTFNNYGNLSIQNGTLGIDGSNGELAGRIETESGTTFQGNELIFTGDTIQNNGIISVDAFDMGGTNMQWITGTGEFANLRLNNSNNITLDGDQLVSANLLFDQGKIYTGGNSLKIGATTAVSGASEVSYVVGNMERYFNNSITLPYDIGDGDTYVPLTLTASITDPGYILAKTEAGDHPAIVTSGIEDRKSVV